MSSVNEEFVTALYDYHAKDPEELTIRKNELLTLLDGSGPWYKVRNKLMHVGLVPSNYVKCKSESIVTKIGFRFPGSKRSKYPAGGSANTGLSNSTPINHADGDSISKKMSNSLEKYVAKYNYAATQMDELDLTKGVTIDVISKEADGWWQGKGPDGRIGWFPSNYVENVTESNANDATNLTHPQSSHEAKPVLEVVKALYPFRSDNSEELSFELGDLFDIIGKPPLDPEWYEARNAEGKIGLIPRNYVETVPGATSASMPEQSNYDDVVPDMLGNNIPVQYNDQNNRIVGKMDSMIDKSWYFGSVKRADAERMLLSRAQNSQFMVRDSESTVGDLSVSMKAPDKIKHFKVSKRDGKYCIGQRKFESVEGLIEHYRKAPIYTAPEIGKIYLSNPMPK